MGFTDFKIRKDFIRISFICWIFLSFIIFYWPFEEHSKAGTFCIFTSLYTIGTASILWFRKKKLIENINLWILVFSIKIVVSIIILSLFWLLPLEANGLLRTPVQDPLVTDANYYDYAAMEMAKNGFSNSIDLLFSTWLSFGVIAYLYGIYMILGKSILYVVLTNVILILWAALLLRATVKKLYSGDEKDIGHNRIAFIMLLPYGIYYDASPSKESLTIFTICLFLYFLANLIKHPNVKFKSYSGLKLLIAFVLVMFVRPNLAVLILIPTFIILWKYINKFNLMLSAVLIFSLLYSFIEFSVGFSSFYNAFTDFEKISEVRNSTIELVTNNQGIKSAIANYFAPDTTIKTLLGAPIRFLIWLLLPFPFILPDWEAIFNMPNFLLSDWNAYFRLPEYVLRLMSTWLIIFLLPVFTKTLLRFYRGLIPNTALKLLLVFFVVLTLALSTYNFINGGRYRVVVEPLYFTICVIGSEKNKIINSRYIIFYISVLLIVLVSYLLKSI